MLLPNRWAKVDNRSVRSHQKLVDAINQMSGGRQTKASTLVTPNSTTTIPDPENFDFYEFRLVVVTDTGPAGTEDDYTDARYWGRLCEVNEGEVDDQLAATPTDPTLYHEGEDDESEAEPNIITFTNIPEIGSSSHTLQVDEEQPIWVSRLVGPDGTGHWFSNIASSTASRWGKIKAYTAGSNTVTLTPCDVDGTVDDPAPDDVDVNIVLPATRTICSFFGGDVDDVLPYFIKDGIMWLATVPMPFSSSTKKVFQVTGGGGQGGFDNVRLIL